MTAPHPARSGRERGPPRSGSLTRTRGAARSRDARAGRSTGSRRPRSRAAERGGGGGAGQQPHQLSRPSQKPGRAPAQLAPVRRSREGGTAHALFPKFGTLAGSCCGCGFPGFVTCRPSGLESLETVLVAHGLRILGFLFPSTGLISFCEGEKCAPSQFPAALSPVLDWGPNLLPCVKELGPGGTRL